MKESLARVLTEWQETWTPELIERDFDFSLIPEKPRKVVTFAGCRRTGKDVSNVPADQRAVKESPEGKNLLHQL
ncbi:hypothetical protein [Thermococcus sp. JCM 11816]|uniref:hypothetical protein n=1 Tax=Thermococcus sp. (strain JCM 11816 / KS-1) TaxID=1295125 RepID=UPI003465CA9C